MMTKLLDLNRTIRHRSYRQMRAQWDSQKRLSDLFFKIMVVATIIGFLVFAVISVMAR